MTCADEEEAQEWNIEEDFFLDDREPDVCPHCGKEYEDFSDMGCEYCDTRYPLYGIVP